MKTRMKKRGHIVTIHSLDTKGIIAERALTPAQRAREEAGFIGEDGLKRLARRMQRSVRLVKHVERHGGASDDFAQRWSRVTKAPAGLVFYGPAYYDQSVNDHSATGTGATATPSKPVRLRPPKPTGKRTPTRTGTTKLRWL